MRRRYSVPLAWSLLTHHKPRLLKSLSGITFAVFLIFAEIGFYHGLYDSQIELINQLNADIIITSAIQQTLTHGEPFARRRLYQARALPGVVASYPLYTAYRFWWKNLDSQMARPIRVLAFNPAQQVFSNPDIVAQTAALQMPQTALIDTKSKRYFGRRETGVVTELSGKTVRVVGTFQLGTDFNSAGTVVMSDRNFLAYFPTQDGKESRLGAVEIGIVRVASHANASTIAAALQQTLPPDVAVYTKQAYIAHEMQYWREHTPIGALLGLEATLGFVIGVIICYQILYTEVVDHLSQFATMKAIGYRNRYVVSVVLKQAIGLSCLGFGLGLVLGNVFYSILASWTGLLIRLTVPRAAWVLALTVVMCILAGGLAARKVSAADPGEVF